MGNKWREVKIGTLCNGIFDGPHATPKKTLEGPIFLGISSLNSGRLDLSATEHISETDFVLWTRRVSPQQDDIVFSYETRLGEAAIIPSGLRCCLGRRMALMRPDPTKVYPRFLLYCYIGPEFQQTIRSRTVHGSTVDRIPLLEFPSFSIRIPEINTQKAIASILGALDDKIELNRQRNRTLEAMARALFQSWFVDFDPVKAKAAGKNPPGLKPEIAALFPDSFEESELGMIPKGWRSGTLNAVLDVLETGSRPKGGVGGILSGVPSVGAESIVGIGKFEFSKTKYVPIEFFESMRKGKAEDYDVFLYKDGGKPGLYEPHVTMFGNGFPFQTFCINEHVYRLRVSPTIGQAYLYFWLNSELAMEEMRRKGTGVAIPGLNSTAVRSLNILIPTESVLKKFECVVLPLVQQILLNSKMSCQLSTLRDSLLPKLISGELRIPEAERIVSRMV